MLKLSVDECKLIVNALDALAKRDGLSQPAQFHQSTRIAMKLQEYAQGMDKPQPIAGPATDLGE